MRKEREFLDRKKGKVIILDGIENMVGAINHVWERTRGKKVFGVMPDVEDYRKYDGLGWELRIGMTVRDLDKVNIFRREVVVIEVYDVEEFNHYIRDSEVMWKVLRSQELELYLLLKEKVQLKLTDRVEKIVDGKEVKRNNHIFYQTILERSY